MNNKNYYLKLLIEAIVVGILTVLIGLLISKVISLNFITDLPKNCKDWNKNHIMEICLFFTGLSIHLFCEFIGINKWYCRNGAYLQYKKFKE